MFSRFSVVVLGVFCLMSFSIRAQVLNLLNSTKTIEANSQFIRLPPKVVIADNSGAIEQHYNLIMVDTTAKQLLNQQVSILAQEQAKFIRQKYFIQDSIKTTKETLKQIAALEATIKRLGDDIKRQQDRFNTDQSILRRRLNKIYTDELKKLQTNFKKNSSLFKNNIDSLAAQVTQISTYNTQYWLHRPAVEDVDLVFASDSAYQAFYKELLLLQKRLTVVQGSQAYFQTVGAQLAAFKASPDDVTDGGKGENTYNDLFRTAQTATDSVSNQLAYMRSELNSYNQKITAWSRKFADKSKDSATNLTTIPALTSGVGGVRMVIPTIDAIASRRVDINKESSAFLALRLFTAFGGQGDTKRTNQERGGERLFIREASNFGFSTDASFAFVPAGSKAKKMLAITIGAAYLDKFLTPDSLRSFTTGTVTSRLGFDFSPVPGVISIYANLNTISFLTNRSQVEKYYTTTRPKDMYGFTNLGVRAYFTLDKNKGGTGLEFDIGFIYKGGNVQTFVPNEDVTITTIKATFVKSFSL